MLGVLLDTSFLIHFADRKKAHHEVAHEYYRECLKQRIPMYLSAVAIGEFEVKQPIRDLPMQHFRVLAYEATHAVKAAHLFRLNKKYSTQQNESGERKIIVNDLKLIAQAAEENIRVIITSDRKTLAKIVDRLQGAGALDVFALVLSDGSATDRLTKPEQAVMTIPSDAPKQSAGSLPPVDAEESSPLLEAGSGRVTPSGSTLTPGEMVVTQAVFDEFRGETVRHAGATPAEPPPK